MSKSERPMADDDPRPTRGGDRPPVVVWRDSIANSELPSTARLVALTLSLWMNTDGSNARPGGETLRKASGLKSLRSVRSALTELVEAGFLSVTEKGGSPRGKARTASVYDAAFPSTTGAPDAPVQPVQEMHRCISRKGPVHLTTPTGAPDAPQEKEKRNSKEARPLSAAEFVRTAGGCQHEETFVERAGEYFTDESDRAEALELWRRAVAAEKTGVPA